MTDEEIRELLDGRTAPLSQESATTRLQAAAPELAYDLLLTRLDLSQHEDALAEIHAACVAAGIPEVTTSETGTTTRHRTAQLVAWLVEELGRARADAACGGRGQRQGGAGMNPTDTPPCPHCGSPAPSKAWSLNPGDSRYTAEALLRRVVAIAVSRETRLTPAWVRVKEVTGLGSGFSQRLIDWADADAADRAAKETP